MSICSYSLWFCCDIWSLHVTFRNRSVIAYNLTVHIDWDFVVQGLRCEAGIQKSETVV